MINGGALFCFFFCYLLGKSEKVLGGVEIEGSQSE